jgi:hypothetical protein
MPRTYLSTELSPAFRLPSRSFAVRRVPTGFELLYSWGMSRREPEQTSNRRDETFTDERGVELTRAGVERAGERIAESQARHDRDYFASLRDRLGIVPRSA